MALSQRWREVGCAKYCIACPPTPEVARLALFRCAEVEHGDFEQQLLDQRPDKLPLLCMPDFGLAGSGSIGEYAAGVGTDWQITQEDMRMLAEYNGCATRVVCCTQ
eukprot:SAG11_NODE_15189_length_586_cov_0.831622_1_plen_105_part_10